MPRPHILAITEVGKNELYINPLPLSISLLSLSLSLCSKPHPLTTKLPLPEDNPLISATLAHRSKHTDKTLILTNLTHSLTEAAERKEGNEGAWLSEVELVTHATPTRRLWMGPQFFFKTYTSNITVSHTHLHCKPHPPPHG